MNTMQRLAGGAAAGVLALALTTPAAYAQQTTASLRGLVVDASGAAISGATVTIVHLPSDSRRTVVSDSSGGFDVPGLRVGGPYRILATKAGFQDQSLQGVSLTIGDAQRVTLAMAATGDISELVVTGTRAATVTEPADTGSRITLDRQQIEAVVSVKRDIRDLARRDPLATLDLVSRSTGPSGGVYIAGSLPRDNRITIDGVRSSDSYGLNTGGLSTNRGPVSFEAIEQFTVQAAPFDVEDGDFTGGAINIVLRSGGNQFHGSAFDFYRNDQWVGHTVPIVGFRNNDVTQPAGGGYRKISNPIDEKNYGAFLSGPIWRDHLFFAASYEKFTSFDTTSFGPAGSGFANIFNKIPGVSTGAGATQADIDAVLSNYNSYAAHTVLPPGAIPITEPIIDKKYSLKLDWDITDGQRLTGTYRRAESSVFKRSPSATSISLDTNWYQQPEVEDNYALQLNSQWTSDLSTEARVTYRKYTRGQEPPEGQGFANLSICTDPTSLAATFSCSSGVPAINIGPDQFRQANVLATKEWAGEVIGRYRLNENHLIKAGYQFRNIDIYNLFLQQAHGVYYFDSVADFAAGRANQLSFGNALTGNPTDAAATPEYRVDTLLAEDSWDVTRDLTVNYGLRVDRYDSARSPTLNTNFVSRYGFANTKDYDGLTVYMPRISARYTADWFTIGGGVGLFSGGVPDVFLGNSYGATTGALTNAFSIRRQADGTFIEVNTNTPVSAATGTALLNLNKADPSFVNTTSALAQSLITADSAARRNAFTNSLAPGFKMPSTWKANASFKAQRFGLDFGVDGLLTQTNKNVAFRDLRARLLTVNGVQQYTPDGRLRYDGLTVAGATPAAVNAARAAAGLPVSSNPDLANLGLNGDIQAYNPHDQTWIGTVAFSVGKEWRGFSGLVSYAIQDGRQYGGISEFGTTAGGNATSGAYYPDQSFDYDPNAASKGKANNLISHAYKANLSYKFAVKDGWESRFTLFGEEHAGRPISFLMSDPAGNRNPTFGVSRDDALVYVPSLASADPTNPLKFTTNGTTVFFDSQASLTKFKALVSQFNLPQGGIVKRGFGRNPDVNRIDFQYAQDIPLPIRGQSVMFTADITNLGNLLNKKWGVVKEYSNSRAGGLVVNAQCADASGVVAAAGSPVCASYRYSYTTVNPTTLATPVLDQTASLWSIQFGLKYRF
jgi:hypothetical protein